MTDVAIQASFNSGEWSPNLYARVDLQKYRSGAALLSNFFVDYRGGASTRTGSAYVIQAYASATPVRIIPFQAAFNSGYIIEIGNGYMRFHYHGQPVTETALAITGATNSNPAILLITGHNYVVNDWIFVTGIVGMTQLNGRYFKVTAITTNTVTIGYLTSGNIDSTSYSMYTSGGTAARIYTIPSPYTSSDNLRQIKYAQSIGQMILVHPNHPAYILSIVSANSWNLTPAAYGAMALPPTGTAVNSTLGAGTAWYYSYVVTSVDSSGEESSASTPGTYASTANLRSTAGTNTISWTAAPGAVRYNVYEAELSANSVVVSGANFGFVGTCTGVSFQDSNIAPDFSLSPPIAQNPFIGSAIASFTVNTPGTYGASTTAPTVSLSGGSPILPATASVSMAIITAGTSVGSTSGWNVGDTVTFAYGIIIKVATIGGGGSIATFTVLSAGSFTGALLPSNPAFISGSNPGGFSNNLIVTNWQVGSVQVTFAGSYLTAPTVVFSLGAAAATANLGNPNGNPTAVGFVQQRLSLGGLVNYPATFYMSQPAQYFNFNISNPVQANNAVQATLVSNSLNNIKSMVGVSAGMLILTDQMVWLINGGGAGAAITPSSVVANPQSFDGANDVPPIVLNYDVLMVGSKGSNIWDLAFNFYFSTFTAEDISVISSHLFYGYTINEWSWSEQPFYKASAVRSDGTLLSLTFLKQQQFNAWSHFTTAGTYQSTAAVTEVLSNGTAVDANYVVVTRTINGNSVQYIERFAERNLTAGISGAWTVDASIQYVGSGTLNFFGAEQLAGATVTGIGIDNNGNPSIIAPFTMPTTGFFTLPPPPTGGTNYTQVTIGLGYVCQLQTLPLDIDGPSIQGKVKKIQAVDIKVRDSLGLQIGSSFGNVVNMKDLIIGNVSTTLTGQPAQIITGLVSGDAWTILDPTYTVPGQYCIQANQPWPATVLGVFPQFIVEGRNER